MRRAHEAKFMIAFDVMTVLVGVCVIAIGFYERDWLGHAGGIAILAAFSWNKWQAYKAKPRR